jgi:hypothetical protein
MSLRDDFKRKPDGMWPGTNRGAKTLIFTFLAIALLVGGLVGGVFLANSWSVGGRVGWGIFASVLTFAGLMACICAQNPE